MATPASFGSFEAIIVADALVALPDSAGYAAGLLEGHPQVREVVEKIQQVQHSPVFTLMVGFESSLGEQIPFDAVCVEMMQQVESQPTASRSPPEEILANSHASGFQWIARNSSKPGRIDPGQEEGKKTAETWVAITTPEKARELLQRWPLHTAKGAYNPQDTKYRDGVAKELLDDFLTSLQEAARSNRGANTGSNKLPQVIYCHAQRWGRGFVENPVKEGFLAAPEARFAVCGDFCRTKNDVSSGSPLETAWRSGRDAADAVAAWLEVEAKG